MALGQTVQAQQKEKVSLMLNWYLYSEHAPFFLGRERGYYEAEGIDLDIQEGRGSGPTIQAVAAKTVPFAYADVGTMINPVGVKGQIHGGVAQGLGQALMERVVYDPESGQLLTGSFMDYAMPRAGDMPHIEIENNSVPTTSNPMGAKGAGEAGTVGALPAVMNAVNHALASMGAAPIEMPATSERVWTAIQGANQKA